MDDRTSDNVEPRTEDDNDKRRRAKAIVAEVVKRIVDTIGRHDCAQVDGLEDEMATKYLKGFLEAINDDDKFWDKHKVKVLRMAGHAGSLACFLVEKEQGVDFLTAADKKPTVEERHWLMAMAVIRTACLVRRKGDEPVRGIPCNTRNFEVPDELKHVAVRALATLTQEILSDD